jgi:hypothetical protein
VHEARCEIVILVWAMARASAKSMLVPPRKCKMRTPFANPSWLTRMKSRAGP